MRILHKFKHTDTTKKSFKNVKNLGFEGTSENVKYRLPYYLV